MRCTVGKGIKLETEVSPGRHQNIDSVRWNSLPNSDTPHKFGQHYVAHF